MTLEQSATSIILKHRTTLLGQITLAVLEQIAITLEQSKHILEQSITKSIYKYQRKKQVV